MTQCLMVVRHLSNCSSLLILYLRDYFDVLYQGENSVFGLAFVANSQTSRKRQPKMPRFSGRLRELVAYESRTRRGLFRAQV